MKQKFIKFNESFKQSSKDGMLPKKRKKDLIYWTFIPEHQTRQSHKTQPIDDEPNFEKKKRPQRDRKSCTRKELNLSVGS